MGAPNTVYLFSGNATFPIHLEGEIKLDSYPALPLAIYGDQIKQLFYLDSMLMLDDEQGNTAFIGMIKDIPGSLNYRMHSAGRFFKLRLAPGDTNQEHIVLNDAGLNTLAFCEWNHNNAPKTWFANYILSPFHGKSSFFSETTERGFEHKKLGTSTWVAQNFGNKPMNSEWVEELEVTPPDNLYKKYDTVEIRPYIKNEEGTFYGEIKSIGMLDKIYNYVCIFRGDTPCGSNGDAVGYWTDSETYNNLINFSSDSSVVTGIVLFKDQANTITLEAGWYAYLDPNNINKIYYISHSGEVQMTTICEVVPDHYVTIATLISTSGVYTPVVSLRGVFSGDITVEGDIGIYDGAFLVESYEYRITVPAGSSNAAGEDYYVGRLNRFRIISATALPYTMDGKTLNSVVISNF